MDKLYRQNVDCTITQLHLFTESDLPRKPYCSDDLAFGVKVRPLKTALRSPYIQVNPPHLRMWLVFDVDRPNAGLAWIDGNVTMPNWTARNPANGHAHLAYGLSAPVLIGDTGRNAPIRYLAAVEAAMCAALEADPSYSGLLTKNPLHGRWDVLTGSQRLYQLADLVQHIDLDVRAFRPRETDAPQVGVGRNCWVFDNLREWAYPRAIEYRGQQGAFIHWQADVMRRAALFNGDLHNPLHESEVSHIGRSVSRWTWRNMVTDAERSDARFSRKQAIRGSRGGKAKSARYEHIRELAITMLAEGQRPADVAASLGVSLATVYNWRNSNK